MPQGNVADSKRTKMFRHRITPVSYLHNRITAIEKNEEKGHRALADEIFKGNQYSKPIIKGLKPLTSSQKTLKASNFSLVIAFHSPKQSGGKKIKWQILSAVDSFRATGTLQLWYPFAYLGRSL